MLLNFVSSLVPELKTRIKKYFEGYEEALPSVLEAILRRKLAGKHKETDDELMDELEVQPRVDVDDEKFESNFTNLYSTGDEEDSSLGQTPPRMIPCKD
ncbi:hypothetical protein ES332_A09G151000v1 [Gossypium tomentosum]|uniref:Uncharacterized protein n=1 Tax=Gossypium tomentosum TaxID=34277 RepID=A0A5D2IM61_GOSTO|nr:hypothetical protein ES332_D11G100300v1 [Gossypium tomentosum]TYH65803.1 hypothetical protein ES332_D06G080500v1 [Gossypium tomentosum]TYI02103.1 hypothetical protein ES332_A11G248000v1 [Gossypium tomentosum]TYI10578.1 hypothetical protein ES332_A09G151000v1 [Gossypium tomentosum]